MSYRDFYTDPNNKPYQGTYVNILTEYQVTTNTPAGLRTKVYGTGNAGGPICWMARKVGKSIRSIDLDK